MTNEVSWFKDGSSKRILILRPRDKVNMLCDKTKNYKLLLRSLHEKSLVPMGGKPVILWPSGGRGVGGGRGLTARSGTEFTWSTPGLWPLYTLRAEVYFWHCFYTCGVVYSVAVVRLVRSFFLQITTPFTLQGPVVNGPPGRFLGFSLKAFYRQEPSCYRWIFSIRVSASNHQIAGKNNLTEFTI